MGCDIHICTEAMHDHPRQGWYNCDNWRHNRYKGTEDYEPDMKLVEVWNHRNYEIFSNLADVRNYLAVEQRPVLAQPRDLPEDVTRVTKEESDRFGVDGHSHSHCTLAEMRAFARINDADQLQFLIKAVEDRMKDEFWIFGDKWDVALEEKIRIVFWFDN